jgi:GNAT superfamily N-acetyltransferase
MAHEYRDGHGAVDDPAAIVEDAQAYLQPRGSMLVEDLGDVVVRHVPFSPAHWFGAAMRPRFNASNVDERIAAVRGWFADHGRDEFMWMIGQSATPADLVDRLLDSGAQLDEDPVGEGMILDHEPPLGPREIEVRRVQDYDDFRASSWITLSEAPAEIWEQTQQNLQASWEETRDDDSKYAFLAFIDGKPVANGQLVWLANGMAYLGGASTLPEYRGRGAFRALVRARWDDAVAHGQSILLVQAGQMSAPTLTRLGFRPTGRISMLDDRSRL